MMIKIVLMSLFVSAALAQKVPMSKDMTPNLPSKESPAASRSLNPSILKGPATRKALNIPKKFFYTSECSLLWSKESDPVKKGYDEHGQIDNCIKSRKYAMQKYGCETQLAEDGYEPVPVRPKNETRSTYRLKMNFESNCEVRTAKPAPLFKKNVPREVVCPENTEQNDLRGEVDLVVCVPKGEGRPPTTTPARREALQ